MAATHLDRSTTLHVATLSSLSLSDEETTKMTSELGAILKYVEELASVDTEGVLPTMQVKPAPTDPAQEAKPTSAGWREDTVQPGLSHEDALAQAPNAAHDGFSVPGFIDA